MVLALLVLVGDGFVYTESPQGVIVPASKGAEFVHHLRSQKPDGFFTPTLAEVKQLEAKLIAHVKKGGRAEGFRKDLPERLPKYARQYVGIIVGKQRRIWLRAFADLGLISGWKTKPVVIKDGGDSVLTGEFDLKQGTFLFLEPNGLA